MKNSSQTHSMSSMVLEFHEKFNLDIDKDVDKCDPKLIELRLNLIKEEYFEIIEAFAKGSKCDIAKELVDAIYVILGTMITFGMDPDKCFACVHESNMTKLGKDGKPVYREDGKVIKSDQYIEADLTQVLG